MTPSELVQAGERALFAAQDGGEEARSELERLRPLLAELAQAGDAGAQSLLGGIALEYLDDPAAAFDHWTRAAAQGDAASQRSLGFLYLSGAGVDRDVGRAEAYFRAAAEAGDADAQYNLALLHMTGEASQPLGEHELESMLRSAASQGIVEAGTLLGDLLGRADRDEEALRWYLWSAEQGDPQGMYVVACWHRDGFGTAPDPVQAVRWFLSMIQVGSGNGIHEAIELARAMTDDQIEEAGRLAGDPAGAAALIKTVRAG